MTVSTTGHCSSASEELTKVKILVVDDEQPIRLLCDDLLTGLGHDVILASDGQAALSELSEHGDIDIVITDIKMPGMSGLEVLSAIEKDYSHLGVIVLTGYASIDNAVEAMKLGAFNLIRKPFNLEELITAVDDCIIRLKKRNQGRLPSGEGCSVIIDDRLKELEVLHNEFLSVTSHELLTPLTPVIGYVESLIGGDLGPLADDQKLALDVISGEIEKLRSNIANILRIKELADESITVESMLVEPAEIVESQIAGFAEEASDKAIRIDSSYTGEHRVSTDPHILNEILKELISNAIRFGKKGGFVLVRCSCDAEILKVSVEDNGIGIDEEKIGHVFDKFYRVHKGEARKFSGIGIGLTLVKGLVERLGGTVSISSVPDSGTIVSVTLSVSSLREGRA